MITVDGNDGTGKSTLVRHLQSLGFLVQDRGLPTILTDDPTLVSEDKGPFLILDAPVEVSQGRLQRAGKDLTEKYHTLEDLTHYRERFRQVASSLGVTMIDARGSYVDVLTSALYQLGVRQSPRLAIPTGHLEEPVMAFLRDHEYDVYRYRGSRIYHIGDCREIDAWRLKARSIPQAVALGIMDYGITGLDILQESLYADQLLVLGTVLAPTQRLCVLRPSNRPDPLVCVKGRPIRIATEYPKLASEWAYKHGLAHVCIQTWGTTEAWVPALADIAVDVVSSGETARANGLEVVETILEVPTVLVARRSSPGAPHHRLVRAITTPARMP